MKKKKLIDYWLAKGKLLSPEVFKEGANLTKLQGGLVLKPKPMPKIFKKLRKKESRSVEQIQEFYRERFEKLKAILLKKLDQRKLLSINKLSKGFSGLLVGIVRKIYNNNFLLEDLTGCILVKNGPDVIEDEVIAVRGQYDGKFFKTRELIRPDIEMKVSKAEINARALFLSGKLSESAVEKLSSSYKASYVFLQDCDKNFELKSCIALTSSDKFTFLKLASLQIMLLSRKLFSQDGSDLLSWLLLGLRRRHLNPLADWKANDALLLSSIPDIIHCSSKSACSANYKGTSILLTSKKQGFLVDLQSRKIKKVNET